MQKGGGSKNIKLLSFSASDLSGVPILKPKHLSGLQVDPKVANRSSRLAQEIISTIVFTVAVGLVWYDLCLQLLSSNC